MIFTAQYIVIAEENPWLNLPEIEPIEYVAPPDFYFEENSVNRAGRGSGIISFDELTEALTDNPDEDEFYALLSGDMNYSELTEGQRVLIFSQINIAGDDFQAAEALFAEMEAEGISLFESIERVRYDTNNNLTLGTTAQLELRNELRNAYSFETTTGAALSLSELSPDGMPFYINSEQEAEIENSERDETEVSIDSAALISPMSMSSSDVLSDPFNLHFNADESVTLNTGAFVFRQNIISLPGRNGFGFDLDMLFNSGYYDVSPYSFATGWMFDLPSIHGIHGPILYLPGRGSFEVYGGGWSGFSFSGYHVQDMWFVHPTESFQSGSLHADQTLRFVDGTRYFFNNFRIIGMVDRFGNTIRFEYGQRPAGAPPNPTAMLTKIIDSNNKEINISYNYSTYTQNGLFSITVTGPDGNSFVISGSRFDVQPPHVAHIYVNSVRNQAGMETTFTNQAVDAWMTISSNISLHRRVLIQRVNYPSGARLNISYGLHGQPNRDEMWTVTDRWLTDGALTTRYQNTSFSYQSNNISPTLINNTTVTQNNGLSTSYSFGWRGINTGQIVRNNGVLVSEKTIVHDNTMRLPISVTTTEFRNGFQRTGTEHFTYNARGQVTEYVSPMAQGSTHHMYRTYYSYDSRFGLPLTATYMPDAQTTIVKTNALSADGRSITGTYIHENGVWQSRTDFLHDIYGNVTEIREYPNVSSSAFITTQMDYNSGTLPSAIRTTGVQNPDGTLLNGTGTVQRGFTYDSMWRKLSETDPNGSTTQYQYDGIGRVTRINYPVGGYETYTYNNTQNTVTYRTVLGASYVYYYNRFGNLLRIVRQGNIQILTNTYDTRLRLSTTQNATGATSHQRTTYTYDVFDRVTETTKRNSANSIIYRETTAYHDVNDYAGNARVVTTIHGDVHSPSIQTFTEYDRYGRKTQEGTIGGKIITYNRDLAGRVIREQSLGVHNIYSYNIFGVTHVTNIENNTARNVYDNMGRLIQAYDFIGNTQNYATLFTYDALGRLLNQHTPFERGAGNVIHYAETRYYYDRNGNVIRQDTQTNFPGNAAEWASTTNTYTHNRLTSSQTGGSGVNGITTSYTYNNAGNILTATTGGATTTYTYNTLGQLTETRDAIGNTEAFTYDNNGCLLTKRDRNHNTFTMTYDGPDRLINQQANTGEYQAYTYTATGAIHTETNGAHTIAKQYDAQGRLIRQDETDGAVLIYQYNAANNQTRFDTYVNGLHYIHQLYYYDAAQRPRSAVSHFGISETYTYDANGSLASIINNYGIRTDYTRNLAGLITNAVNSDGYRAISSFSNIYLLDGNVNQSHEQLEAEHRYLAYEYDSARRLKGEYAGNTLTWSYTTYAYDTRGNRASMTATGVQYYSETYTYNLNNQLTQSARTGTGAVTRSYTYDANGNQLYDS
jgi:YD repeat-containing protein